MYTLRLLFFSLLIFLFTLGVVSCASTTESGVAGVDRKQLLLIPADQIHLSSSQSYEKLKREAEAQGKLNRNKEQVSRVKNIAQALIPHTTIYRSEAPGWSWEANVISSPELNAFCMPGGKIIFYSGIIEKLQLTDGEIAAIMGHEIAHALREHSRERMSQAFIEQFGIETLLGTGKIDKKYTRELMIASTLALALPNNRQQESEADEMGVELMARAGYDPQNAVSLWRKMGSQGGGKPPEFLSTHPSGETRIRKIEALIPKIMPLYKKSNG